jgi:succinoglycan biosynthesis protein ExoM
LLIEICVCTFKRPSLEATLRSLGAQVPPADTSLRIIIADNDDTPSARELVMRVASELPFPVVYIHAPSRNISIARNACLDAASGDFLAFIDDDEVAPPTWLQGLFEKLTEGRFDAVFGPAIAQYPQAAPAWIRTPDYHSNVPAERNGTVQTGHTCNAMISRTAPRFEAQRFLLEKGRTGGEDTEFFFRAWCAGARMAIAEDVQVFEPVDPARLKLSWIAKRKYRSGITYGRLSRGNLSLGSTAISLIATFGKIAFCMAISTLTFYSITLRNYWFLRAIFHVGVFTSVLSVKEQELYG